MIDFHGRLQTVKGKNYFIGEKSKEIVYPAGCSLFWSSASGNYYNESVVKNLKTQFNCQIIRCAMTAWSGWSDGYIQNPEKYKQQAINIAEAAIKNGIYCIIDWHCEGDNSPYLNQAKTFFAEMAKRYSGIPNIIYEIWNEPKEQTWNTTIRPYCVEVIKEIRKYDSKNLVLCGTQTWSQKVEDAAKNPIDDPNIAYVLHFYSNLHGSWLYQNKANLGVPVFVSEWGTPGQHPNTKGFLDWLENNKVPHCSWAINNKAEPLSYFTPNSKNFTGTWDTNELTDTGKIFLDVLRNWKGNQISIPPTPTPTPPEEKSITIEAENFQSCSSGVKTENSSEGGKNVGWINDRSWMIYRCDLKKGKYRVEYRVASPNNGGQLRIDTNQGKTVFGTIQIPDTRGWQKWTTISHNVELSTDLKSFGIFAIRGKWNLNWIKFTQV